MAFSLVNATVPEAETNTARAAISVPGNMAFSGAVSQNPKGAETSGMDGSGSAGEPDFKNSRREQFLWLAKLGFETVEFETVTAETLPEAVKRFAEKIESNDIPSDGLVLLYDDIAYGQSLGRTAKFPRDSIAFKWADELQETTLSYIEWSASRTGLINPVAVFEPVELEGTTVSRASVHNISIMEGLELGAGDRITVYKANMIIPPGALSGLRRRDGDPKRQRRKVPLLHESGLSGEEDQEFRSLCQPGRPKHRRALGNDA